MEATMRILGVLLAAFLFLAAPAQAAPVLMISIDGLRPLDIIEADKRGVTAPNLQKLLHEGAYATGVRDALPSVTYPNHTTLVTGVWPAQHGIEANLVFDPLKKNMEGWYWYNPDIKVPTLWDAVHGAGGVTASLGWPVTVDAKSIDNNIPEYWRAFQPDDLKLIRALCTPGLLDAVAAKSGVALAQLASEEPPADEAKAKAAAAIIALKRPQFFTLHLSSLDSEQHEHGPGSPEALESLKRIDAAVGDLIASARQAEPDLVVMIVSDHGFASVEHDVNIGTAFVEAGLITLKDDGNKPQSWEAAPWISGGSAAVVVAHPDDAALMAKVKALLDKLAADPASGIAQVIARPEIAAKGGGTHSDFFIDAKIGYEFEGKLKGPLVTTPSSLKGMHGYFPDHPEMRATLIIAGPGVTKHGSLGEVDMRDIAPTAAKLLGVAFPSATGKPLF
jgi:predicted AlkP superfamily pyrophosphatase or phosphodiesterase